MLMSHTKRLLLHGKACRRCMVSAGALTQP